MQWLQHHLLHRPHPVHKTTKRNSKNHIIHLFINWPLWSKRVSFLAYHTLLLTILQYSPLKQYQQLLVSIKKTKISRDTTKLESYRESLCLKEAFLIWLLYILQVDSLVHHEFHRSLGSLWYTHNFSGEWSFSLSAEAIFDFLRRAKLGEDQEQ